MYELAQLNIAHMLAPLDDARMAEFVAGLDPVNAAADSAPGFVWRLQTEDGNATAIRVYDDEWLIVNASVWSSVEALIAFVYSDEHRAVLRRRREWFERLAEATTVLWWVPAGHRPDVVEAQRRLDHLRAHGPTATAFTLRQAFPPPGDDGPVRHHELAECRVD
jgi:heme-degrading monooxygenase HmoA